MVAHIITVRKGLLDVTKFQLFQRVVVVCDEAFCTKQQRAALCGLHKGSIYTVNYKQNKNNNNETCYTLRVVVVVSIVVVVVVVSVVVVNIVVVVVVSVVVVNIVVVSCWPVSLVQTMEVGWELKQQLNRMNIQKKHPI